MVKAKNILLDTIQFPSDLRKLKQQQLPQFCEELRRFIVDVVSSKGGHFGASFGVGNISECYQLLIKAIKIDPNWNDQEARKKLISFINNHDLNSEDAKKARRQLSSILFN